MELKMKTINIFKNIVVAFIVTGFTFAQDVTLSVVDNGDGTMAINMVNTTPVAGFQIEFDGIEIGAAEGGSAGAAGEREEGGEEGRGVG